MHYGLRGQAKFLKWKKVNTLNINKWYNGKMNLIISNRKKKQLLKSNFFLLDICFWIEF